MAEPSTPQAPFDPTAPRGGPGCSKPLLIGCGMVLLLVAVFAVVVIANLPAITRWWFNTIEASLEPRLAPDVTPAERQRLKSAFSSAGRLAEAGKVDMNKLPAFQRQLLALSDPKRRLSRKDVQELTRTLDELTGKPAPPPTMPPGDHRPGPSRAPAPPPGHTPGAAGAPPSST
ncbi:MAG TPA: hypothetical protein VHR45_15590 [Thermoanaerobaculia bacterium]|nr:hypothetical protein [Thermoanaerobaculia bacterium]